MKIQLSDLFLFSQRKNVLFAFIFIFIFSFNFSIQQVQAFEPSVWSFVKDTINGDNGARDSWGVGVATVAGSAADTLLKPVAIAIISAEAFLANGAAVIFVWVLDPNSFSLLMNNSAFYEVWKIARDTMNMLFILVLLFSAFATIYQIDKYKYNKILWMVIIMALLVNFSWPISRTIIDFFNSMMYFFVQSVFQTNGGAAASGILGATDLKNIFLPANAEDTASWPQIFIAIIVMFIFMMTLLTLALMMLIRLVALPVLIMFSPVGFAGLAAPLTQDYAKQWWDKLFKYASFGPIAVFMMLVAVKVLQNAQGLKASIDKTALPMSADTGSLDSSMLSALVYYAIPIILFWIAITSAENMSSKLSSSATKKGMELGRWARRQPWRGTKAVANWTGVPGGVKQAWKDRRMFFGSDSRRARESREAHLAGLIGGGTAGFKNATTEAFNKRVAAEQEALKKFGNVSKAQELLRNGSTEQKKAAALYLSEKEALTSSGDFQKALSAVGKDFSVARNIISKAPKSVLANATDLGKSLEILNVNGHQKLFGEVIAKAEKKALGDTGNEYDTIVNQLKVMKKDGNGNDVIDDDATKELKKTYDKRIAEQGQAHIRVESHADAQLRAGATTVDKNAAIKSVFDTMGADNVVKQKEIGLQSAEFIAYIKSRELEYRKQLKAAAARDGGRADTVRVWRTNGV
jgi:hypothetical protein